MHYLQNRWKLEGKKLYYYGLRNRKDMFRNSISISAKQREVIAALPKNLNGRERKILKNLLGKQVVTENRLKKTPTKLSDARFCTSCCANDFIIPGLEFDENGLCPMCQTEKTAERLKSILPIVHTIPRSPKTRFDVAYVLIFSVGVPGGETGRRDDRPRKDVLRFPQNISVRDAAIRRDQSGIF